MTSKVKKKKKNQKSKLHFIYIGPNHINTEHVQLGQFVPGWNPEADDTDNAGSGLWFYCYYL